MSFPRSRDKLRAGRTLAAVALVWMAACRPGGCEPDTEPLEPPPSPDGGDAAAAGGGDAGTPVQTIHYSAYTAPERTVAKGVVQYDVSRAGVFVLGGDGVLHRHALDSFERQQALSQDGPDGGSAVPGMPGKAVAVAAALQGEVVALGYASGQVELYAPATLDRRATVKAGPPLLGLGLSADGQRLATVGQATVLWDTASAGELKRVEVAGVRSNTFPLVQLSRDGTRVAITSLSRDGEGHDGGAAGPKGKEIQTAGRGVVVLWDVAGGGRHVVPKAGNASDFALSLDGKEALTGDYADGYDRHDATTGAELGQVRALPMASLALSPNGATVAVGDTAGNLWLLDRDKPDGHRKKVQRQGDPLSDLRYGAAGKWLYGMQGAALQAIDTSQLTPTK